MSKISDYLRQHLTGEVATDAATRQAFARDGSILEMTPQLVVYPRTTNDVRKVARFAWRLAERGQVLPLTARGGGTSTTGSAIGGGVALAFAAHMSRILELDVKSRMVRVQPGLNLAALQEAMATHGLCLPVMPDDFKAATIGGALASNVGGTKSVKYGRMRDWTDRLEVVLANGEVIQTERLNKHELSGKKGLQTMEGEIYRSLDALIDENAETVANLGDGAGFAVNLVKSDDGSFDLTPLFVGSEGALGVITQAIVRLAPRPDEVELLAAALTREQNLSDLAGQLGALEPSELEFIDGDTFKLIAEKDGGTPWQAVASACPATLLFVEFDDKHRERKIKKAAKILAAAGVQDAKIASSFEDQEMLRAVHHSTAYIANFADRGTAALPLISNVTVDPARLAEFLADIKKLLRHNHVEAGIWGSLGTGAVNVRPLINLANLGQRQTVLKFMNEVRVLAREFGGTPSDDMSGGRLNAPFAAEFDGEAARDVFIKLKTIFDPYGTLNPGVKVGLGRDELVKMLRQDYDRARLAQFNLRG